MPCPNLEGDDRGWESGRVPVLRLWDKKGHGKVPELNVTIERNESNEMISCSKLRLKLE